MCFIEINFNLSFININDSLFVTSTDQFGEGENSIKSNHKYKKVAPKPPTNVSADESGDNVKVIFKNAITDSLKIKTSSKHNDNIQHPTSPTILLPDSTNSKGNHSELPPATINARKTISNYNRVRPISVYDRPPGPPPEVPPRPSLMQQGDKSPLHLDNTDTKVVHNSPEAFNANYDGLSSINSPTFETFKTLSSENPVPSAIYPPIPDFEGDSLNHTPFIDEESSSGGKSLDSLTESFQGIDSNKEYQPISITPIPPIKPRRTGGGGSSGSIKIADIFKGNSAGDDNNNRDSMVTCKHTNMDGNLQNQAIPNKSSPETSYL